jgi:hypothetical protein
MATILLGKVYLEVRVARASSRAMFQKVRSPRLCQRRSDIHPTLIVPCEEALGTNLFCKPKEGLFAILPPADRASIEVRRVRVHERLSKV